MHQAVEQRQYRAVRPDPGADRVNGGVEVVMLGGQQHDIIGPADPVGGDCLDRHAKIAERACHREAVLGERGGARPAHQKRHVAPRLGEPPAEIAADRAGPEHEKAHVLSPCRIPIRHRKADRATGRPSVRELVQRGLPGSRAAGLAHRRLYRAAVRPLTRARPRSTSTASLSCSSLVVPISPLATVG